MPYRHLWRHRFLLCGWGFEPLRELREIKFDALQTFFFWPQIAQICTDFYCVVGVLKYIRHLRAFKFDAFQA
jgi:hypothetical protein